ncbi:hypothetical protein [Parafilimonas sp.]|uniref:hypothetical protein n=1 Tax=Parafilimonas sp. TaxID=1969739 RepID=UPI0039E3C7F6
MFKSWKPERFANSLMHAAYNAIAPDTSKWTSFIEQMIAFAGKPFDFGDSNIANITAPVLIISGDNDGLGKIELMKIYKLLGGGVSADLQPMPKSQLAVVPYPFGLTTCSKISTAHLKKTYTYCCRKTMQQRSNSNGGVSQRDTIYSYFYLLFFKSPAVRADTTLNALPA